MRAQHLIIVLSMLLLSARAADAQLFEETQKLTASDGAASDLLGWSAAISGDRAIVGAFGDDGFSGSAYVFERDGSGNWSEVQKLIASDGAAGDRFGWSVAISGDRAIVGAWLDDDNGTDSGSAYVFERDGSGNWSEVQKLTASDGATGDWFGWSVSISADRGIVGAPFDDDNGGASGSAYVFERDGTGNWSEVQKHAASDGAGGDRLGWSVAISVDRAIAGAYWDDDNGSNSGSAYVFERDGGGNWSEVQKLTASDGTGNDQFGWSIGISGDRAIVGADRDDGADFGSAYVFERDGSGNWNEVQKLTASDEALDDRFAYTVAISGDRAIVGAPFDDDNGSESGSAYVFGRDGSGSWNEVQKLTASDSVSGDRFGWSVSTAGERAIAGAYLDDDKGTDSGAAYVFEIPSEPLFVKEIVDGPDEDGDGEIDRVIEVGQSTPTEITIRITFRQPDLAAPALILDTIPAEWELSLGDCVVGNTDDLLLVFPAGRSGRSATKIHWHPTDNDSTLTCTLHTRRRGRSRRQVHYAPTSCGALRVNDGARAVDPANGLPLLDEDGNPLVSNTLCLAAVEDFNGDGVIDYTGNGDEDGDMLTDWVEACVLGTDPCDPDTDDDGVSDGVDADPLNPGVQ